MSKLTREHDDRIDQIGSFVAGLLIGGLLGAGMMLLFAPQSGKKTRAGIEKKGKKLRKQFVKTVDDTTAHVRAETQQIADDVVEQAEGLQERGQEVIDKQRDDLGDSLEDLGEAVHT